MFPFFKRLWRRFAEEPALENSPITLPAATPRIIELGPARQDSTQTVTEYVLPLRWSLHYALTQSQWRGLRERHKKLHSNWGHCSCPKRCNANTLDEKWNYDRETHTKIFRGAEFICSGCHWLKTPPWRIQTWMKQQNGLLPGISKPPHVIDCLGWTQEAVDTLRDKDLREHRSEIIVLTRLGQQVAQGKAAIIPAPSEKLSPKQFATLVKPGQVVVSPWRIDLAALAVYGYSADEIALFEQRMYKVAAERMSGRNPSAK